MVRLRKYVFIFGFLGLVSLGNLDGLFFLGGFLKIEIIFFYINVIFFSNVVLLFIKLIFKGDIFSVILFVNFEIF